MGEHVYSNTLAAVKVLYTISDNELQRFQTEARTLARLKHPSIIRLLEFGVEGNTPFLVIDYASNGSLGQRHRNGETLPLTTVIPYVKQIVSALQYAHNERLFHQNIKPKAMLLGSKYEILLDSWDIAIVFQNGHGGQMRFPRHCTLCG